MTGGKSEFMRGAVDKALDDGKTVVTFHRGVAETRGANVAKDVTQTKDARSMTQVPEISELAILPRTLAKKFTDEAVQRVLLAGGGPHHIMAMLEGVIVASMIANIAAFELSPQTSVAYCETAMHNAIEKISRMMEQKAKDARAVK